MIRRAENDADLRSIRELFREYWSSLGAHVCFQDLEEELKELPGSYAPPAGQLLLAEMDGEAAGCVAMRALDHEICELKRLYVREQFRGHGLGRKLVDEVLESARGAGYKRVRLDTLPSMQSAQRLYESLGFYDIPAYYENQIPSKRNMELRLD